MTSLETDRNAVPFKRLAFVCFLAGSGAAFGMAPYNLWPLLLAAFSVLYAVLLHIRTSAQAFLAGWLFSFGYFLFSLNWIGNALLVEGNEYAWAWPLAVAGLPFILAFFGAAACGLAKRLVNLKTPAGFLAFTAFTALFEWLRGHVFTGFPWNLYGYTWADILPVVQMTALSNTYYLTWLTIFWGATPAYMVFAAKEKKAKWPLAILAVISFGACYGFGAWRLSHAAGDAHKDVYIHMVQANIPQSEKWKPENLLPNLEAHLALSLPETQSQSANSITFIVWPESAISYRHTQNPLAMNMITEVLKSYPAKAYLLTGMLRYDPDTDTYANAMVMIDQNGRITNVYNKHHLVPFGEYIPFQEWIPLKPVVAFSGFAAGKGPASFSTPDGLRYAPLVCYEVIFPANVILRDHKPDFIVNTTNDAWYGKSAGPHQHFTKAVFRAVEEGIPVVRVANTGISGVIGPLGRVSETSALYQKYEKTLALPYGNMVIKKTKYLENGIYIALIFFFIFTAVLRNLKI